MNATTQFNRDSWAALYARKHLQTDPGIQKVLYLPAEAPEREIRLVEVNELLAIRDEDVCEAIDFGVDRDSANAHTLKVLDVTPSQWERIQKDELTLPDGWSLLAIQAFGRNGK